MCRATEPGKQGMFELPKYEVYSTKKRGQKKAKLMLDFKSKILYYLFKWLGLSILILKYNLIFKKNHMNFYFNLYW